MKLPLIDVRNTAQQDFLDMTDIMEGQSLNVLAALAAAKETALENRDRFAFFRAWSDAYVGVRTTGIQVGMYSIFVRDLQRGVPLVGRICYHVKWCEKKMSRTQRLVQFET